MAKSTVTSGASHDPGREPPGWPVPDSPELAAYQAASNELHYAEQAAAAGPVAAVEAAPEPAAAAPDDPPAPPPASALKAEHVEYVAAVLDVPVKEAESMTKPELVELAKKAAPPSLTSSGDSGDG